MMGTSTSSSGPRGGVPYSPPVPSMIGVGNSQESTSGTQEGERDRDSEEARLESMPELAPNARFKLARQELSVYARTGDKSALGRALGHYSANGMGGARNISARMKLSSQVAANLAIVLSSTTLRDTSDSQNQAWLSALAERKLGVRGLVLELVRHMTPDGGSIHEEATRNSMAAALSEFLELRPDADLLALGPEEVWSIVDMFLANEAISRIQLEIGQVFESSELPPSEALQLIEDMQQYLQAEISTQVLALRDDTKLQSTREMERMLNLAIEKTFYVFEVNVR